MDYDYWIRFDRGGFTIHRMPETIAHSRLHADAKTLCARRDIYREIFEVCRKRGGYISRSYVDGLWQHLVYERSRSPARLLRGLPGLRSILVTFHFRWLNRSLYTRRQWLAWTSRVIKRRLARILRRSPRLFAILVRTRARLRSGRPRGSGRASIARTGRLRVKGFWPDNWVERQLDVVVDARDETRQVKLIGAPVAAMTVQVSAHGRPLRQFVLAQNGRQTIDLELPPGPEETITFDFSDHVVDGAGRPVSFMLDETDLFSEDDLRATV
jgi:hypothetical protein